MAQLYPVSKSPNIKVTDADNNIINMVLSEVLVIDYSNEITDLLAGVTDTVTITDDFNQTKDIELQASSGLKYTENGEDVIKYNAVYGDSKERYVNYGFIPFNNLPEDENISNINIQVKSAKSVTSGGKTYNCNTNTINLAEPGLGLVLKDSSNNSVNGDKPSVESLVGGGYQFNGVKTNSKIPYNGSAEITINNKFSVPEGKKLTKELKTSCKIFNKVVGGSINKSEETNLVPTTIKNPSDSKVTLYTYVPILTWSEKKANGRTTFGGNVSIPTRNIENLVYDFNIIPIALSNYLQEQDSEDLTNTDVNTSISINKVKDDSVLSKNGIFKTLNHFVKLPTNGNVWMYTAIPTKVDNTDLNLQPSVWTGFYNSLGFAPSVNLKKIGDSVTLGSITYDVYLSVDSNGNGSDIGVATEKVLGFSLIKNN